jgi:hypothetical protein
MAETTKTTKKTAEVQRVPVFLRPAETGEQNFVRVVVNGKAYQIPRGRQQMVPRPVYEVLARSEQAKHITRAYNAERVEVRQDRS